jgi:hypothetical protein
MKDTSGLAFNGQGGDGYSRNNSAKVQTNQHTGYMNDGRLVNKGRGPTVGNKSDKDSTYPKVDAMPAVTPGKDMFTNTSQYRGVGGTSVKKPGAEARINMGRGPTKGNQV